MILHANFPLIMSVNSEMMAYLLSKQMGLFTTLLLSLYSTRTQNTWRRRLALGNASDARILRYPTQKIPTCWYLWRWVKQIFRFLPDAKPKICVTPDANPRRQSVEYRWRWASGVGAGVGHVHFIFFVLISFAFCSQRKPSFRWNMGFNIFTTHDIKYLSMFFYSTCPPPPPDPKNIKIKKSNNSRLHYS